MYRDPAQDLPLARPTAATWQRAAERKAVNLLVRYAWNGMRATAMLKDLTPLGGRIEGVGALRKGDWLTLLLPGLAATHATVAWTAGSAAGLRFDDALDLDGYEAVIANFAVHEDSRYAA